VTTLASLASHVASFWTGRTVLVTGATGFLGGVLTKRLIDYGADVVAVVRRARPTAQFYREGLDHEVEVEHGDVADETFMRSVFERRDISAVFHAAYGADVNKVLAQPLECFRGNIQSTWIMLELMRELRPKCISVISSSDKAYGSQELPLQENKPLQPVHPYEVAKASQDLLAQSYGRVFRLPTAVTRCGNFFGGNDLNFTRLIPGSLQRLAGSQQPVLRSSGRSTRDFLYIDDAADAQLLLAMALAERTDLYGEAFNFSYGLQIEVIDLVRRLIAEWGGAGDPIVEEKSTAEIQHLHLSSNKAVEMLGWMPSVGFDEGLRRTVAWYREYLTSGPRHEPV
jgi:dTDP-glucose 4,6-dehydratase